MTKCRKILSIMLVISMVLGMMSAMFASANLTTSFWYNQDITNNAGTVKTYSELTADTVNYPTNANLDDSAKRWAYYGVDIQKKVGDDWTSENVHYLKKGDVIKATVYIMTNFQVGHVYDILMYDSAFFTRTTVAASGAASNIAASQTLFDGTNYALTIDTAQGISNKVCKKIFGNDYDTNLFGPTGSLHADYIDIGSATTCKNPVTSVFDGAAVYELQFEVTAESGYGHLGFDPNSIKSAETPNSNFYITGSDTAKSSIANDEEAGTYNYLLTNFTANYADANHTFVIGDAPSSGYTATFAVGEGGTPIDPVTGTSVTLPTPERTGYTFEYWTVAGDETHYSAGYEYTLSTDTEFVAKWKDKATATFTTSGSECESITVDVGTSIKLPDTSKNGFTFDGWTVPGSDEKLAAGADYTLNENTTFTANFTELQANNKTATFDSKGGSNVASITKEAGEKINLPAGPKKDHYTFAGWKLDETVYAAGGEYVLTDDVTFEAQWTINQYTATFDANGGDALDPITDDYNKEITLPTPNWDGRTFEYWTISGEGQYTESYVLTGNVAFTAKWKDQATATFTTSGSECESITVDVGTSIKLPDTSKNGFTFDGWTVPGSDEKLVAGADYTLNENTTFTANFTEIPANYKTATFDTKGGSNVASITKEAGEKINLPAAPKKDHYTFAGWKLDETVYTAGVEYVLTDDVTFEAQWTINQYTATFDANGGDALDPITDDYNKEITLPTPNWDGHTFNYWVKEGDDVNTYEAEAKYTLTGDAKFTAVWVEKATLTFVVTDGTAIDPKTVDVGTSIELPVAEKEGFTFDYWSISGSETQYKAGNQYAVTGDVEFTANWVAKATATFDSNEGDVVDAITEDVGTLIKLPNATRSGFTFLGWKLKNTAEDPREVGSEYLLNGDVTFVAQWEEIPANMVIATFDVAGGNPIASKTVEEGTPVELPLPIKAGYTFIGWKVGESTSYYLAGATYALTTDTTFVAQWEVNEYKLTYKFVEIVEGKEVAIDEDEVANVATDTVLNITTGKEISGFFYSSNDNTKTVMPPEDYTVTFKYERKEIKAYFVVDEKTYTVPTIYGSVPVAPSEEKLVKYGYVFYEWDKALEAIGVDEVTYTAKFNKGKFTAVFDANGGTFDDGSAEKQVANVEFEATIQKPEDPTKQYYKFAGWYVDGDLDKTTVKEFAMTKEGIKYVAKWEQDLDNSYVKSVERVTKPYYETGLATYEIIVAGDRAKIKLIELDETGAELIAKTYSKDNLVTADKAGLVKVEALENDQYKWTVNAYLAEGNYKALAKISSTQWETIGYNFTNTFDTQTKEDAESAGITEIKASANEVVRGEQLTWTIKTGTDVEWLKFVSGDKATWYKANSSATTYTVSDEGDVRTWTIPMTFTYAGDANRESQEWSVEYCKANSSTFLSTGVKETIVVKKTSDVIANPEEGEEDFCIKSATAETTQTYNERGAITVVTSMDVTKVQVIGANEKKTTFQKEDANVQCVEKDGTLVWTINYKFTSKGTSTYKVKVRGSTWGEATTVGTITVA